MHLNANEKFCMLDNLEETKNKKDIYFPHIFSKIEPIIEDYGSTRV